MKKPPASYERPVDFWQGLVESDRFAYRPGISMSYDYDFLAESIAAVEVRIARAAVRARRDRSDIELVAVSKTHPLEVIREARQAGLRVFGENRVQEARGKIADAPSDLRWHFIGHLQSNKVRHALPLFELIHSVDSLELAVQIDRIAAELGLFPRILLEVNVAGEASKFGFRPEAVVENIEHILALPRLQLDGLMTVPPIADEAEKSRPYFVSLRELRDRLANENNVPLAHLSMGMSGDFEIAIEEGATLVRVGSSLFGKRS